jgi:ABC-type multidrug transport system fused ATPase/permease subunit
MAATGSGQTYRPSTGQVRTLFDGLSARSKRNASIVAAAVAGAAFAELAMLAAVLLFVGSLLPGEKSNVLLGSGPFASPPEAASLLIVAAVLATGLRLLVLRSGQRFATDVGHQVATRIFAKLLRQPLASFSTRHSSIVISGMEKVQILVTSILLPLTQAVTGTAIAIVLLVALVSISPISALTAIGFLGGAYLFSSLLLRERLVGNSERVAAMSRARIRAIQEALGSIRDILLEGSQDLFERRFAQFDREFRQAHAANLFLAAAPRHLVEAAGVIAVGVVAMVMSSTMGGLHGALPSLAAVTFVAYRLLPLVQQTYFGWSQLTGNRGALADVLTLLSMPVDERQKPAVALPKVFCSHISFDRVTFAHSGQQPILREVDLKIVAGDRVGIVGVTGSGKSSLLDLLMGLREPTAGEVRIDGQLLDQARRAAWRAQIAHAPQRIFLLDASVLENIAFAQPRAGIDWDRAWKAAQTAQLEAMIVGLPHGLETIVGENGVRLSGGERQRLGIARALYRAASVLVLDEATNSLDHDTEARILSAIARDHRGTLIIAGHRASSLSICDTLLCVEEGAVRRVTSPAEPQRGPATA